jgi:enoyl-CoA hydratase/carnithine racemase
VATIDAYLMEPAVLSLGWTGEVPPLAFVDLDRLASHPPALHLPPFPVIGLGDPAAPWACALDAVIEAPVTIARIVAQVERHPKAAAALVQLLRATEAAPIDHALALESLCYGMLQGSAEHLAWIAARPKQAPAPPGRIALTREDTILRIVMDRSAAHNAIDRPLRDALFEAFTIAALDGEITRVEWRSVGPAFGVGADLTEFGTTRDPASAHIIRGLTLPAHPMSRCGAIVDVHVQGACVGSTLEMAMFAGRVTASPRAWFHLPELAMGVIPGAGGCVSVPRRIGRQRAALMILSGQRIDARTALSWGLIDAIVDEPPIDPAGLHAD